MNSPQRAPAEAETASTAPAPPDPFANARPSDLYWTRLKPVFKAQKQTHAEALVQIAVTHEQRGMLELLRLEARPDGIAGHCTPVEVLIDHKHKRLRFGPLQTVQLAPAQRGLGGFLLAQLCDWCLRNLVDYQVTPIILHAHQVTTEEQRQIRERLLRRAGFEISYQNEEQTEGRAQVNDVSALISSWNNEKIEPLHIGELLRRLREQEATGRQLQAELNQREAKMKTLQQQDAGQRFAIFALVIFCLFQALLLLWVVLR